MKTYIKNKNIVKRNIHEYAYLIDITENYLDEKCRLYEINQVGSIIWDLLDDYCNDQINEISRKIKSMIIDDIPFEIIKNDVKDFLSLMKDEGFLKEVDNGRTEQ